MASLYEQFNAVTFESYVKTAIDNRTTKERMRKKALHQHEQNFSDFPEAMILAFAKENDDLIGVELPPMLFEAAGEIIPIEDQKIGQALSYLLPRDREIILLRYFYKMRDGSIAARMNMSRATVQRRRQRAEEQMRQILENLL